MSALISGSITEFFYHNNWEKVDGKYKYTTYDVRDDLLLDPNKKNNTYLCICGPTQDDWLEKIPEMLAKHGGKIVYQSPKAINFEHDTEVTRNTLILFEFD